MFLRYTNRARERLPNFRMTQRVCAAIGTDKPAYVDRVNPFSVSCSLSLYRITDNHF